MKKKLLIVSAMALLAVVLLVWLYYGRKENGGISFNTVHVQRKDIRTFITATGTIEPVTEVEVGTQVSGIIDKIYVDYNSVVKVGDVIAEMDKVTLLSDLQSAKATYDGAEAEHEYQKKLFERNKKLHDKQLISDTDFEDSEYNYKRALSAYEQAQAALAKAERNLSYATITSPIDGVVTSKDVEEGQTVASGFETPTLFTIAADLTKMQVVADVDEADIAGVSEGNNVIFTVDAYPDDVFTGTVRQVRLGSTNSSASSSSSSTSETVVTYEVVITADNPELKLKPRLTANVTIYTSERSNVLAVPSKALRFNPVKEMTKGYTISGCESENKVWSLSGNNLTAKPVETGLNDGTYTEIISGLEEGTSVVTDMVVKNTPLEEVEGGERSPFMPGPPDRNKKK